jgi:hypothetical protein
VLVVANIVRKAVLDCSERSTSTQVILVRSFLVHNGRGQSLRPSLQGDHFIDFSFILFFSSFSFLPAILEAPLLIRGLTVTLGSLGRRLGRRKVVSLTSSFIRPHTTTKVFRIFSDRVETVRMQPNAGRL